MEELPPVFHNEKKWKNMVYCARTYSLWDKANAISKCKTCGLVISSVYYINMFNSRNFENHELFDLCTKIEFYLTMLSNTDDIPVSLLIMKKVFPNLEYLYNLSGGFCCGICKDSYTEKKLT